MKVTHRLSRGLTPERQTPFMWHYGMLLEKGRIQVLLWRDREKRWHLWAQVLDWFDFQFKGNPWLFPFLKLQSSELSKTFRVKSSSVHIYLFGFKRLLYSYQGSSARLVITASLGNLRVWREIQNLYMRFVILKVRNLLLFTVSRGTPYVIAHSPGLWDGPT